MNATTWTAVAIPSLLFLGAACVSPRAPFRVASLAASLALLLALATAAGPVESEPTRFVRLDAASRVMLVLVAFIAAVIVRYSRRYLDGDPARARYERTLLLTLAAVDVLVLSNDLLLLALAWMMTSVFLHRLLTFYGERPEARIAAHKKFLLSRLADVSLLSATVLVAREVGSLRIDETNAWALRHASLTPPLQVAAILLVVAVSLKSAQLPFHGWLIQVMEAPTPVSALLHAGVVNIGGFVMIRLAPLMSRAPLAETLLVVVGTTTAVVAALVTTTRVSIKVALAWSTCAQMGFMLVECGLGAWSVALLHLVAHSLYKAHAFLSAGMVVDGWRTRALSPRSGSVTLSRVLAVGLRGGAVFALYVVLHATVDRLFAFPEPPAGTLPRLFALGGFTLLLAASAAIEVRPGGRLARALQPRLFAGLYLDELFTPPHLSPLAAQTPAPHRGPQDAWLSSRAGHAGHARAGGPPMSHRSATHGEAREEEARAFDDAIDTACARIAPTWPLDRFIAVNPLWERIDAPLPALSVELAALSGARLVMPAAWFREERRQGRLGDEDLEVAIDLAGTSVTPRELCTRMESAEPAARGGAHFRARVMDVVDAERDLTHQMAWRDFVVHSSSQFCAAHFDDGQARLRPDRDGGLYPSWRRVARDRPEPSAPDGPPDVRPACPRAPLRGTRDDPRGASRARRPGGRARGLPDGAPP